VVCIMALVVLFDAAWADQCVRFNPLAAAFPQPLVVGSLCVMESTGRPGATASHPTERGAADGACASSAFTAAMALLPRPCDALVALNAFQPVYSRSLSLAHCTWARSLAAMSDVPVGIVPSRADSPRAMLTPSSAVQFCYRDRTRRRTRSSGATSPTLCQMAITLMARTTSILTATFVSTYSIPGWHRGGVLAAASAVPALLLRLRRSPTRRDRHRPARSRTQTHTYTHPHARTHAHTHTHTLWRCLPCCATVCGSTTTGPEVPSVHGSVHGPVRC
jgi:hypothetical protein